MTHASELYDDSYSSWGNYSPMISSFGRIVIEVSVNDYQGDTWVLYHDEDNRIGHLIFGWGSCSGCDALQGCNSIDEVEELREQLERSIMWFSNPQEALDWFKSHDWKGDWGSYYSEQGEYVKESISYLEANL